MRSWSPEARASSAATSSRALRGRGSRRRRRRPRTSIPDVAHGRRRARATRRVRERAVTPDVDAIVHLAAETSVLGSVERPEKVHRVNVDVTAALLELARERGVGDVRAGVDQRRRRRATTAPFTEEVPLRPLTPYGATKAAAEMLVSGYAGAYGMRAPVLRLTNVYGPGMQDKDTFVPRLLKAAARDDGRAGVRRRVAAPRPGARRRRRPRLRDGASADWPSGPDHHRQRHVGDRARHARGGPRRRRGGRSRPSTCRPSPARCRPSWSTSRAPGRSAGRRRVLPAPTGMAHGVGGPRPHRPLDEPPLARLRGLARDARTTVDEPVLAAFHGQHPGLRLPPVVHGDRGLQRGGGLPGVLASLPREVSDWRRGARRRRRQQRRHRGRRAGGRPWAASPPARSTAVRAGRCGSATGSRASTGRRTSSPPTPTGSTPPTRSPTVLAPVVEGRADFVTGSRRLGALENQDAVRQAGTYVFAWLATLAARSAHHRHLLRAARDARRGDRGRHAQPAAVPGLRAARRRVLPRIPLRRGARHDAGRGRPARPRRAATWSTARATRASCSARGGAKGVPARWPRRLALQTLSGHVPVDVLRDTARSWSRSRSGRSSASR